MIILVLPAIVFSSAVLLCFAVWFKSVPSALLNLCTLALIGLFLELWANFSSYPIIEDLFSYRLVLGVWLTFFFIGITALIILMFYKKRHHRHRHYTF